MIFFLNYITLPRACDLVLLGVVAFIFIGFFLEQAISNNCYHVR